MKYSYLKQALRKNDTLYIQSIMKDIKQELQDLDNIEKIKLLKNLRLNIDEYGLAIRILEIAKIVILSFDECRDENLDHKLKTYLDDFCNAIMQRTGDVGRLFWMRGKIDYLKMKCKKFETNNNQ